MIEPSNATIAAWTRLLRAHQATLSRIEDALKTHGLPPLSWYDVLLELERAGKEGLRPFELEDHLLLPQYGVSRLVDRVEKAGYLERQACDDDRRGQVLVITLSGLLLRKRMWPIYAEAIEDTIGRKLTNQQTELLAELLSELVR